MKIAITGHTSGIGKCLYDTFTENGNTVLGFSRSNGYDITSADDRKRIVDETTDCDVFINNAFNFVDMASNCQLNLLEEVYEKHYNNEIINKIVPQKNLDKILIINMGSLIEDIPDSSFVKTEMLDYKKSKTVINEYCKNRKILNIKPGAVKSEEIKNRSPQLYAVANDPQVVYQAVNVGIQLYKMPNQCFVYTIELG